MNKKRNLRIVIHVCKATRTIIGRSKTKTNKNKCLDPLRAKNIFIRKVEDGPLKAIKASSVSQ